MIIQSVLRRLTLQRANANHNEVIGLQYVRFMAALAVLVDHLMVSLAESGRLAEGWLPFAYNLGNIGVYLFFGISGFVMVLTNRTKFQAPSSSRDFLIRRVIRIWPMYCIATLVVFAMKHSIDPMLTAGNLAKSLSFI